MSRLDSVATAYETGKRIEESFNKSARAAAVDVKKDGGKERSHDKPKNEISPRIYFTARYFPRKS
jgi:hypothetical protein